MFLVFMSLTLHTLKPAKGSRKARIRIGRGLGSTGSYSGRGVKGQRARSGGRKGLQLRGLRPVLMSTPKNRGFKSLANKPAIVNLSMLNGAFVDGARVTPATLRANGLIRALGNGVKILAQGSLQIKITVDNCAVSEAAKEKIQAAGGTVTIR